MSATAMTHAALEQTLEEVAADLSSAALMALSQAPQGTQIVSQIMAIRQNGDSLMVALPPGPDLRLSVLTGCASQGMVAFVMVYDGYLSHQCQACDGQGCAACDEGRVDRTDALLVLLRTAWGYAMSKAFAYGYDHGQFLLKPERHAELKGAESMIYGKFDHVWDDPAPKDSPLAPRG